MTLDFDFVGTLSYQNFLANLFSQCEVSLCERNTHDAGSVGENCCSISDQHIQKTTKKISVKICWEVKTPTRTWKLEHALRYANELLARVRLAFQKLLQTRQRSRNYRKQVFPLTRSIKVHRGALVPYSLPSLWKIPKRIYQLSTFN